MSTDDLPWPMEAHRRNSRVLKLLPHLFFPAPVIASVYLDSDNTLGGVNVSQVIRSMLTECGAGFAAQAHKTRSVHVMQEFRAILDNENTVEPDAVKAQAEELEALREEGGVCHTADTIRGGKRPVDTGPTPPPPTPPRAGARAAEASQAARLDMARGGAFAAAAIAIVPSFTCRLTTRPPTRRSRVVVCGVERAPSPAATLPPSAASQAAPSLAGT